MKKYIIFCFLFFSIYTNLLAQNSIKGKIIDASTKEPMDFVNVILLDINKQLPTLGGTTNQDGVFEISKIPSGNYTLRIQFVGYTSFTKALQLGKPAKTIDLGIIQLKEDTKVLKEVEVIGQGSQMKLDIDKKIFSVDQNIAAAGGNITEVLQNIPSVNVDTDGNISLRNNSNVEVWINGKPSGLTEENRAQILEQIPAENIESIEIMTNPSAKFSPEGTAGIINLVMKKSKQGATYGSVNAGLNAPIGERLGELVGASVNFSKGKLDAYINIGWRNMYRGRNTDTYRYYLSGGDTTSILKQNSESRYNIMGENIRFGLNYQLNKKNSIGFSGFGMLGTRNSKTPVNYLFETTDGTTLQNYKRVNTVDWSRLSLNGSAEHVYSIDKKGSELRSSITYSFHNLTMNSNYNQTVNAGPLSDLEQKQYTKGKNNQLQIKTDYTKRIEENSKLETGLQYSQQNRYSSSRDSSKTGDVFEPVIAMDNVFDYTEQIIAAYATYGTKIEKLSVQGGLRGEYATVETTTNTTTPPKKEYFQLFPSLYLTYSLPKDNDLQLNYTRRVSRPRGRQLNSFKDISDSTNIVYGNPLLNPEFGNALELNHIKNWKEHTLSTSVYYRYTENVIQPIRYMNEGVMNSTWANISQSQSTGVEMVAKNRLWKFLNLTSTINVYYYHLDASTFTIPETSNTISIDENKSFSWNARILANFILAKGFSGQISGSYSSPRAIPQGNTYENFSVDLGLRKTLLNRKLTLNLAVRDVFFSKKNKSDTFSNNFFQTSTSYAIAPVVRFTIGYNFGNQTPKRKKQEIEQNGDTIETFMED